MKWENPAEAGFFVGTIHRYMYKVFGGSSLVVVGKLAVYQVELCIYIWTSRQILVQNYLIEVMIFSIYLLLFQSGILIEFFILSIEIC